MTSDRLEAEAGVLQITIEEGQAAQLPEWLGPKEQSRIGDLLDHREGLLIVPSGRLRVPLCRAHVAHPAQGAGQSLEVLEVAPDGEALLVQGQGGRIVPSTEGEPGDQLDGHGHARPVSQCPMQAEGLPGQGLRLGAVAGERSERREVRQHQGLGVGVSEVTEDDQALLVERTGSLEGLGNAVQIVGVVHRRQVDKGGGDEAQLPEGPTDRQRLLEPRLGLVELVHAAVDASEAEQRRRHPRLVAHLPSQPEALFLGVRLSWRDWERACDQRFRASWDFFGGLGEAPRSCLAPP